MKTVLIVIGIVCVLCCGGAVAFFFVTKNAVDGIMKSAKAFGDEAIPAICTDWSLDAMKSHAAPELLEQQPKELESIIESCSTGLGPMKSFKGDVTLNNVDSKSDSQTGTIIQMPYHADIVCEKGNATVDLTLLSRDAKTWKILKINIQPSK